MLTFAPISKSMLPHTMTVFCQLSHAEQPTYLPVVIENVNFLISAAYNNNADGQSSTHPFSIVVDYVNSRADKGRRRFVSREEWNISTQEDQESNLYTLYQDMWLVKGTHPDLQGKLASKQLTQTYFTPLGKKLYKVAHCDICGLDPIHHIALRG